ncbi:MAG: AraC family transcriptional regulator [Rhodospirillaceae bacterium]|nr:MAG: AraC family transcriptional regulator [Rhodospirillaceae bacterium]
MGEKLFYSLEGPLDAIPAERQMRAANFEYFPELVRDLGGDPRWILEHHGMDPRTIRDPDYFIDCKSLVDVFEYCSAIFDDPLFGLRLGSMQEADVFGSVTALCRAAPSFREALRSFIEYFPIVHSPMTIMELVEGRETAELRWTVGSDLGFNMQASYQGILLDAKLLRSIGGRTFRPSYVNLDIEVRQKDVPDIENAVGCPFHSKAGMNAIGFPIGILEQPVASSNRLLFRLLGGYLDRVKTVSRTTIVERVEDYVRGALPSGNCSIERCAKKFGTSVRTLQARLGECGLKFSDILERQRVELAKTYLEQAELSLDEVAVLLGYSEQSSFGRAFKRWTGVTPQGFRGSPRENFMRPANLV